MIRAFFRDGLAWIAVFGAILGAALYCSVPAHADPIDRVICETLDEFPSADGVTGVGLFLMDQGYNAYDAGQKIGAAVYGTCPERWPAVQAFLDSAAPDGMAV